MPDDAPPSFSMMLTEIPREGLPQAQGRTQDHVVSFFG